MEHFMKLEKNHEVIDVKLHLNNNLLYKERLGPISIN